MKNTESEQTLSLWARHAQTILTALVAGLISWVGITVSAQERNMAVMAVQINELTKDMDELKSFTRQPRFTKEDFSALMQLYEQRIARNESLLLKRESWMENTERRITILEKSRHD